LTRLTVGVTGNTATLGVSGQGGVGKTVLTTALAHDPQIRASFPDGIHWVTVGEGVDPRNAQRELSLQLGVEPTFRTALDGHDALTTALARRRALVILDDVWTRAQLHPLLVTGDTSRTVVTTRSRSTVLDPVGATIHEVNVLQGDEARHFLASFAHVPPDQLPPEADRIVAATGGVALALALVGSAMRQGARVRRPRPAWRPMRSVTTRTPTRSRRSRWRSAPWVHQRRTRPVRQPCPRRVDLGILP